MPPIILLLIAIGLTFIGEVMLKQGINTLRDSGALDKFALSIGPLLQTGWNVFTNPFVFFGFVFVFGGSLFWLGAISKLNISFAYPMLSLNYILIVAAGYFIFKEPVNLLKMLGVLVIVAGVTLFAIGESQIVNKQ